MYVILSIALTHLFNLSIPCFFKFLQLHILPVQTIFFALMNADFQTYLLSLICKLHIYFKL